MVLINLVWVLLCSAVLDPTPYWIFLIECSYYFIDVIYHADLESAAFGVVKCHTEVVVNLVLVYGHFYCAVFKDAFIFFIELYDFLAH